MKSMSENIFFSAFNDHPQPGLTDEKPERPSTVGLLIFEPDMEGITADFDKDTSISSITDVEYHKDTGGVLIMKFDRTPSRSYPIYTASSLQKLLKTKKKAHLLPIDLCVSFKNGS